MFEFVINWHKRTKYRCIFKVDHRKQIHCCCSHVTKETYKEDNYVLLFDSFTHCSNTSPVLRWSSTQFPVWSTIDCSESRTGLSQIGESCFIHILVLGVSKNFVSQFSWRLLAHLWWGSVGRVSLFGEWVLCTAVWGSVWRASPPWELVWCIGLSLGELVWCTGLWRGSVRRVSSLGELDWCTGLWRGSVRRVSSLGELVWCTGVWWDSVCRASLLVELVLWTIPGIWKSRLPSDMPIDNRLTAAVACSALFLDLSLEKNKYKR